MPLRDHFHPPLSDTKPWDGFHGAWPTIIVMDLNRRLPDAFDAAPRVHLGAEFEVDVTAYDREDLNSWQQASEPGGAVALWAPPRPTLAVDIDLDQDEYEVRVRDRRGLLVATIEIVSPANKDRPEHRSTFAAKCSALMQQGVCVSIVDLLTTQEANLYLQMLEILGETDTSLSTHQNLIYASTSRYRRDGKNWKLESWAYPMKIGHPLPTLPIWLNFELAIPLELEQTYQETLRALRMR